MKSFKEFIKESTIAVVKDKKININLKSIKLDDTKHSKERQTRIDNEGKAITETEIIKNIQMAMQDIMTDLANGEIKPNASLWIRNDKTYLNIIIALEFHKGTDSIIVVTVMRKQNFKSSERKYIVG